VRRHSSPRRWPLPANTDRVPETREMVIGSACGSWRVAIGHRAPRAGRVTARLSGQRGDTAGGGRVGARRRRTGRMALEP